MLPSSRTAPSLDGSDLALPPVWVPPQRPPLPLVASVVPVIGAVVLWLVTGSMLALWLAALGPLIAVATVADGARAARAGRRRAAIDGERARQDVGARLTDRHDDEREQLRQRHPDVLGFTLRPGEVWRSSAARRSVIVVGTGGVDSRERVTGGGSDDATVALKRRAALLDDAPVLIDATDGLAVAGPAPLAAAVVRAITLQLCLAAPPGELRIIAAGRGETAWTAALPHRRATGGLAVAVLAPDDAVPTEADIVIARTRDGVASPRCAALLTVRSPSSASFDDGIRMQEVAVECLGEAQARALADGLAERVERVLGVRVQAEPVLLAHVLAEAPAARRGHLVAAIGVGADEPIVVDLVADGPHAVVAGVTGSGKSELLVSWVLALCATHSTDEVTFLLADFKGGTAFDALAGLRHVTGVITDLDGSGARRAIESLRAEVRWREGALARAGARDVLDERVDLPRLVIVVDEFAALLGEHPELHAVFADVAARGRALGMHLILGTQRVAGVVRDALLANCPLRVSLRVTDAADSRGVIGTDAAALLPGGAAGAGIALVRRAQDAAPQRVRIALSSRDDAARIAEGSRGPVPRRPWLPDLPRSVALAPLVGQGSADGFVVGLADDPQRQSQDALVLDRGDRGLVVVGGPGSGKTTALATIARQATGVVVIPRDAEGAWDAVELLDAQPPTRGTVVIADDLDVLVAGLPGDYGQLVVERLERLVRGAGEAGLFVVVSAQRIGAATGRIADLLPRRLVLRASTRAEYVALGGEASQHDAEAPPGRGRVGGRAVQVAVGEGRAPEAASGQHVRHVVPDGVLGLVARRSSARGAAAAWAGGGVRVLTVDEAGGLDPAAFAADVPLVIIGDPDAWQRHWRLLGHVRDEHALLIDADCAAEFRLLAADRSIPPYCAPGRRRAWLIRRGGQPERVALPAPASAT